MNKLLLALSASVTLAIGIDLMDHTPEHSQADEHVEGVEEPEHWEALTKGIAIETEQQFIDLIQNTEDYDAVIVKFYGPWCGHCEQAQYGWNIAVDYAAGEGQDRIAAAKFPDSVRGEFGILNKYSVTKFPTIIAFETNEDWEQAVVTRSTTKANKKPLKAFFKKFFTSDE